MSFTPLDADPWIQVVQLARSQGNGLQIMFVFKAEPISFSENVCVSFIKSVSGHLILVLVCLLDLELLHLL